MSNETKPRNLYFSDPSSTVASLTQILRKLTDAVIQDVPHNERSERLQEAMLAAVMTPGKRDK